MAAVGVFAPAAAVFAEKSLKVAQKSATNGIFCVMVKGKTFQNVVKTKGDAVLIVTHKLKMNMEEGTLLQRVEVPLGDVSTRQIEMLLYARQSPWMIPEDVTVLVRYQKADGSKGEYDALPDGSAAWSAEGNALTIALAPQVLTAAGTVSLWAEIYQEEKVLHTFTVELSVKAPYGQIRGAASQDYYYVANVLRGPVMAQAGQVLVAETVDALGRVTKVDAVDADTLVNENGDAILSLKQSLTDGQKEQTRKNINAASNDSVVKIDEEQSLMDVQKAQARKNINAAPGGYGWGELKASYPPTTTTDAGWVERDPNSAWATGIYSMRNVSYNTPSGTWEGLFTQAFNNKCTFQYIYNSDGNVAMRTGNYTTKEWGEWKMLKFPETAEIVEDVIAALPIYSGEVEEV